MISSIQDETKLLIVLRNQTPLVWDSYKMAIVFIITLYIYWKIIILMHLFKSLSEDMGGSPLRR